MHDIYLPVVRIADALPSLMTAPMALSDCLNILATISYNARRLVGSSLARRINPSAPKIYGGLGDNKTVYD
jgi:hypothetical protein